MARSVLEVVLQGVDKLSGPMRKAGESVKDFEKRTKASGASMKALGATALKVTGTLAALGFAAKKAFDLGKEGAAIKQTGDSFGFLLTKVGASTDLLNELRAASKGTISDMDLMSSTSTLLAGAQGELAQKLATSTPKLLEIAKAAQKLNPALGNTTFLYNSLATGVKRASPMILDNLGLTIRIGAANEAYAKALGKTVEQLTADEQKQALLNETLRAGAVLIEQAGGTTDSATDSYAELAATTSNLTDMLKVLVHDGVEPLVSVLAETAGVVLDNVTALAELDKAVQAGILTDKEARFWVFALKTSRVEAAEVMEDLEKKTLAVASADQAMIQAAEGGTMVYKEQVRLRRFNAAMAVAMTAAIAEETGGADKSLLAHDRLNRAVRAGTVARIRAEPEVLAFAAALDEITDSADRAMMKLGNLIPMVVDVEGAELSAATVAVEWAKAQDLAALAAGDLTQEIIDEKTELARLTIRVENAKFKDEDLMRQWIESKNRLADLTDGLRVNSGSLRDNTAAKEANRLATERINGINDLYRIMTGDATQATIALERQIREATAAFGKMGEASGFTEGEIAGLRFELFLANDILRDSQRNISGTSKRLDGMTEAAKRSWEAMRKLGTKLPGQVGGPPPGEYEGKGGAERFAEEQGWQVSAAGRDAETHSADVWFDLAKRHSLDLHSAHATQGWAQDFMKSAAGTGLAAGFSDAQIQAGLIGARDRLANENAAQGLSGIVPGGFPNDSFMIGATSGESVNITPAHMRGRGGGGMVINNVNVYGVQTDSQLFAAVTRAARQRGRAFAKVM